MANQAAADKKGEEVYLNTEVRGANDLSTIPKGQIDTVYEAKARVLNHAIQDIGMGWYQWQLFIVVGFG